MPEKFATTKSDFDFLKNARDIAFIFAVYLYFAGWIYIYSYYNFFGISIRQADMEFYYFLVYSANVLTYLIIGHWFITLCAVGLFSAALYWLKYNWVTYAICIVLFAAIYYSAIIAGAANAKRDFVYKGSTLFRVKFVLKEVEGDTKKDTTAGVTPAADAFLPEDIAEDLKNYNEQEMLKLLLTTKEEYLVLVTDTSATDVNFLSKDKIIYTIKRDDIKLTRIIK
nr:hypothetical protein [uncultured Mucilaginibacter sp.]